MWMSPLWRVSESKVIHKGRPETESKTKYIKACISPNKVLEWKWLMESNIVGFDKMRKKIKYSYSSSLQCNCLPPWSPCREDWTEVAQRDGGGGWLGLCPGAEDMGLVLSLSLLLLSRKVLSNCLWPHGLWHTRLLCPPLSPRVCSNSRPLSWWCSLTVSSSAAPFSFCLHCFPGSGSFPMSWFFAILWWPKYWSFSFSTYNDYAGLISLRIDWFDLPAVQGTLRSLLQHHNSKASVLWRSAFLMVQLSHLYMTTGKTIALTRLTFVSKVMSLLFNILSRFALLPKRKSFNFMTAVTFCSDFRAQENEICDCFHFFPLLFAMKWWDQMPQSSFFECWFSS